MLDIKERIYIHPWFLILKLFPSCKLKPQKENNPIRTFHFANISNDIVVVESFVLLFEFLLLHLSKLFLSFEIERSDAAVSCEKKKHFKKF